MPYIAAYLGSTIPMVTACFAGLYGLLAFAENQIVNEIRVIDSGDHQGKLIINFALSPFVSQDIFVDVRDIKSVVALGDEELGEHPNDGNIALISKYINDKGELVEEEIALTLPGDAFRDKAYLDWILSDKSDESALVDDYQSLMQQRYNKLTKGGTMTIIDLLIARNQVNIQEV